MSRYFFIYTFVIFAVVVSMVLVTRKSGAGRVQKPLSTKRPIVLEVGRKCALPVDKKSILVGATIPVVRHASVPMPGESRSEIRRISPVDCKRECRGSDPCDTVGVIRSVEIMV